MQAVLLIGIQGSGKSTFVRQRLYETHVRLNLDMLRTRNRETILLHACLAAQQPFVVDNTNPTRSGRARYIALAKSAGFEVVGYYFRSVVAECLVRNAARPENRRIPEAGIYGTAGRMELPNADEGFDQLFYVRIADGDFVIEPWQEEGQT